MARTATVTRNTRETQITLTIDLDGTGRADLHTASAFLTTCWTASPATACLM
jgi:imidazoleglycerol-phosphate dehydratase